MAALSGTARSARVASALVALGAIAATSYADPPKPIAARPPAQSATTKLDIPFTKTTLDNGLVVILHEDHALPIVAVNMVYKVGSRFEEEHRTGFAHLFEHLMFMGTQRVPTKMFDAWMEAEGGWNNATTSEDRTDYYDVGPSRTAPLLLWLEADRLSSLGRDMTQAKLDAQREVVRNERRQTSENTPYGKVELVLPELLWPVGHPYHHPVIGSHEDLQAASVDDVKAFFSRNYVPNNASLVVAGDIDPNATIELVKKDFGFLDKREVPPAKTVAPWKLTTVVRKTIEDEVNLAKVIYAWPSPARYSSGDAALGLLADVLADGKASRLYKALVYDKALAQEVSADQGSQDLQSQFSIEILARPGVSLDKLEAAADEEIQKILEKPVTNEELTRAKNGYETGFVARLQGVNERALLLNNYERVLGDPGYVDRDLARYRAVTADSMLAEAKLDLALSGRVVLRVVPKGEKK